MINTDNYNVKSIKNLTARDAKDAKKKREIYCPRERNGNKERTLKELMGYDSQ